MSPRSGRRIRAAASGVLSALVLLLLAPAGGAQAVSAPTATGVVRATSGSACQASWYAGRKYCAGDIRGVRATAYGTGRRIVLHGVTVVDVTTSTLTVMGWSACPPGLWCGALLDTLSVTWSGSGRPRYGDVVSLYGTTTTGSLRPVAAVVTGWCDPDLGC